LRDEYELALRHARKIVCLSASAREEIIEICIDLVEEEPSHLSIELPAPDDVPATLMAALRSSACASNSRVYRDFARDWTALRTIQAEVDLEVYANA
jgi:hypothetical protein